MKILLLAIFLLNSCISSSVIKDQYVRMKEEDRNRLTYKSLQHGEGNAYGVWLFQIIMGLLLLSTTNTN